MLKDYLNYFCSAKLAKTITIEKLGENMKEEGFIDIGNSWLVFLDSNLANCILMINKCLLNKQQSWVNFSSSTIVVI